MSEKREPSKSTQEWVEGLEAHHRKMSQDEEYRQKVAARATNTGNSIEQDIRREAQRRKQLSQMPHLEI